MTQPIVFAPASGSMQGSLANVPAFPGEKFTLLLPERIGDADDPQYAITPQWIQGTQGGPAGQGAWVAVWTQPGELSFRMTVAPGLDTVDIRVALTNESSKTWANSLAFHHFAGPKSSVGDFECTRHWVGHNGQLARLRELPRVFSGRPTVQVYQVKGAPQVSQIPFADKFKATPNVELEDWMAIQSRDQSRLAAIVSKPALFLFQNMQFACIHSAASFGSLQPGQTAKALTRIYLVQATLQDWHARKTAELG